MRSASFQAGHPGKLGWGHLAAAVGLKSSAG